MILARMDPTYKDRRPGGSLNCRAHSGYGPDMMTEQIER
jgi:hypothetical protein